MDENAKKALLELKKYIGGELNFDKITRSIYSTDASMYQIVPDAVFKPKTLEDILSFLEIAREFRLPVTPRGGGSNMTGSALSSGVVVDFTKYLSKVIEINPKDNYCIVEPGIMHGALQEELAKHGKFFPPDPSSSDYCSIGGVCANNSSGIHSVKYGDTKDWVLDLSCILANGKIISSERMSLKREALFSGLNSLEDYENILAAKVFKLLNENRDLIKKSYPNVLKNSSGYNLKDALVKNGVDFNKIFVGSEGTLALFKRVKLKIADIPENKILFLCSFKSLEFCLERLMDILSLNPSGSEMIDDVLLGLILRENSGIKSFLPEGVQAVLLVEFDDEQSLLLEKEKNLRNILSSTSIRIDKAADKDRINFLYGIRKAASPILNRVEGAAKPVRFVEDVAVHPSRLLDFIKEFKKLLLSYNFRASMYGHVGAGNLHINPNVDVTKKGYKETLRRFADEAYDIVLKFDGTLAGEHGDGIVRAPYVNRQYGKLAEVFRKLKWIFDPLMIMNPGKILSNDVSLSTDSLKYDFEEKNKEALLDNNDLQEEIKKCHGCGTCRHYCPVAKATNDEKDSARSKLSILKMIAAGEIPKDKKTLKAVKEIVDHCINCNQCLKSCPTVIDVPMLCIQAKKVLNETLGEEPLERYIGDVYKIMKAQASLAPLTNVVFSNGVSRALMEKAAGIDSRRNLPKFERAKLKDSIVEDASEELKVVYHPGCFGSFNDPSEAYSTISILKKLNTSIKIHDEDCCYISAISKGVHEAYRNKMESTVELLSKYINDGMKIITSSASCGLALKKEYTFVIGSKKSYEVSENTFDIHEYLLYLKEKGLLNLEFKSTKKKVAFHSPCHLRTQKLRHDPVQLLEMIPGIDLVKLSPICCGIAGTFGVKKKNYELSMQIGKRLFDEIIESGAEFVVTSCGTCKMQIEQGTGLRVIHTMTFLNDLVSKV